jgi:hypothetical protein
MILHKLQTISLHYMKTVQSLLFSDS